MIIVKTELLIIYKIKKYDFQENPYKNKNLYIVYIISSKKITKLNEYFNMTPEGEILKYKNIVLLIIAKNWVVLIFQVKKMFYIAMIIN